MKLSDGEQTELNKIILISDATTVVLWLSGSIMFQIRVPIRRPPVK